MQFSTIVAALLATSVAAIPFEVSHISCVAEIATDKLDLTLTFFPPQLQERQCVGNLGQCDKGHVPGFRNCCDGLYCCGIVGPNNVCQTANNCGE